MKGAGNLTTSSGASRAALLFKPESPGRLAYEYKEILSLGSPGLMTLPSRSVEIVSTASSSTVF